MRNTLFTLILVLGFLPTQAAKLKNLAILIPSCDKYTEIWPAFFQLLDRNWPTLQQSIHLISNTKTYPDSRVHHILIPNEKSWSDNMLQALDQIPEEYIMIMLEDYMITASVDEDRLAILYEQMQKEDAAYLGLVDVSNNLKIPHPTISGLGYLPPEADYRNSLQACIWKKSTLKAMLKSGENPWRFELYGVERTRRLKEPFMCVLQDPPIQYFGAIGKSRWAQSSLQFLKEQNINITTHLPIETDWQRKRSMIWGWISKHVTYPIKQFFGIKWYMT